MYHKPDPAFNLFMYWAFGIIGVLWILIAAFRYRRCRNITDTDATVLGDAAEEFKKAARFAQWLSLFAVPWLIVTYFTWKVFDWWGAGPAIFVGLIILMVYGAKLLQSRCPKCDHYFVAVNGRTELIGTRDKVVNTFQNIRIMDGRERIGKQLANMNVPVQKLYTEHHYLGHRGCKHCGHQWVVAMRTDVKR